MDMQTPNMADENLKKLMDLFPNIVTETIDEEGNVVRAIDKDKLEQEISTKVIDGKAERYEFIWPEKKLSVLKANAPTTNTLRPCVEESVNFDTTKNLYIEGDNLEVLKILQETYLGKVKMIYIDPPYNTGSDFVYEDDFAKDMDEYKEINGQFDEEGNRLFVNKERNGRFHTDWLNMMYPRLKMARNFLSDDGVIFISIDDSEQDNLKKICDEIFGADNFVADLIWQKKFSRSNDATYFSTMHDHILCYCKKSILSSIEGWKIGLLPRGDEVPAGYNNPDNDPRGVWTSVILSAKSGSSSLLYEITTPSGRKVSPPSGRYWSCSKETFEKWKNDGRIWFGAKGDGTPRKKTFLSEVQAGLRPNTILFHEEAGHNQEAKQETKALFDGVGVFDGPKPVRLLKLLSTIADLKDGDIVLDFFSGSATTAHAVMELNAEDGGNRQFIMVQIQEETDEKSEAYKAGYKNICEIGKERIRRAGKKIKEDFKDQEGIEDLDIGFRVLKVDSSNMEDIYYNPLELQQDMLSSMHENIKKDRTDLDLLFQVMLDLGIEISSKIDEFSVDGKRCYSVEDDFLIACFDKNIDTDLVKEIARKKPYYAVITDRSMHDDSLLTNFEQIFKEISPDTVRRVL